MAANKTSPILYLMLFLGMALDKVKSNKKTPLSFLRGVWVSNGVRTHDPQNHNLVL